MKFNRIYSKQILCFIVAVVFPFLGHSQDQKKVDETWKLLLTNKRKEARDSFEKHLRKDIDKSIEVFLLDAYIEMESGKIIFDTEFIENFVKYEESNNYLFPMFNQPFMLGNLSSNGYDDYTYQKIDILYNQEHLKTDPVVAYFKNEMDRRRRITDNKAQTLEVLNPIRQWQLCGVFENLNDSGLDMEYEPETYPKNDKLFDAASNGKVGWYNPPLKQDFAGVHFYYNEQEYGHGIMYAQTFIESETEQEVMLSFGSSSSLKIFLNDVEIYSNNLIQNANINAYQVKFTLSKGINRLLLKSSTIGTTYFFTSMTDLNGTPLNNITFYDTHKPYTKGTIEKINPTEVAPYFEEHFKNLINNKPDNPLYNIALFNAYLYNGKHDLAEDVMENFYVKYPESSIIRAHLATLYSSKGENQKAQELYKNMEISDKDYYYNIVQLFINSDVLSSKTIPELQDIKIKAEKLPTKHWSALIDYFIAARNGNIDLMFDVYEDILKISANNENLYSIYCSFFDSLKNDKEKTIRLLEEIYQEKEIESIASSLIRYYNQTGRKEDRIKLLKKQYELYPYINSRANDYVTYLNEEKKYNEVIEVTNTLLQNFPYSFTLLEVQGQAYNNLKEIKQAEKLFRQSLSHNSGNSSLRKMLYDVTKKTDEAEQIVTKDVYDLIKKRRNSTMKTDYGVVILLDECIINIFPEGGQQYNVTYVYEITSDAGVEYLKEYSLNTYSNTILKSEIVKPDGSIVPAEKNYNGFVFTNLKAGDVIYINYLSYSNSSGRFYKDFALNYAFSSYYPIEEVRYGIIYPKDITFNSTSVNGNIPHSVKKVGDKNYMEWKREKVPAIPIYEEYSPSYDDTANSVQISTIKSWGEIANWYADLVQKNLKFDKVTMDTYNSIFPKGVSELSQTEIAKKIYAYIQDNITYSFLDFRQSGYVPQKPSRTITTKLGDCKDLSTLFVTLARKAGLNANLVLVLTNDNGTLSNQLPNIGFNHCIIRVELEGKEHFMELTDNYAPFNTMPVNLYKANALVVSFDKSENAKANLIEIPFDNTLKGSVQQESVVTIEGDQKNIINTITFSGNGKAYYNYLFSEATSEDVRTKEIEKYYNNILGKVVKVHNTKLVKNDKYENELTHSNTITVMDKLQSLGSIKLTTIPFLNKAYTRDIIMEEKRNNPIFYIYYENLNQYKSEIVINIDEGKTFIEIPENQNIKYKNHSYELKYELTKPNSLKVIRTIDVPFDNISVAEYPEYKNFVENVIQAEEQVIGFK
jgi:hypothetical protein